jgi:outer membrane lipoprotein-sorting protein
MRLILAMLAVSVFPMGSWATEADLTDEQVQEIIEKFAAKEAEFARARESYTYRQEVKVEELDQSRRSAGAFELIQDIIFTSDGKRTERVVYAPVSTLRRIQLTPEDEQDLRNVQPFVLQTKDLDKYHIRYLGKQTLDEIPCYTFAVKPKSMERGERYFAGIVWVDDLDLQIVKSYGRGMGLQRKGFDNQFPKFETYRQQIDGKHWFPTYTIANDVLMFQSGPQPIRMTVRYRDYKLFGTDIKIIFGEPVTDGAEAPEP